jgi:hypothetical protein
VLVKMGDRRLSAGQPAFKATRRTRR